MRLPGHSISYSSALKTVRKAGKRIPGLEHMIDNSQIFFVHNEYILLYDDIPVAWKFKSEKELLEHIRVVSGVLTVPSTTSARHMLDGVIDDVPMFLKSVNIHARELLRRSGSSSNTNLESIHCVDKWLRPMWSERITSLLIETIALVGEYHCGFGGKWEVFERGDGRQEPWIVRNGRFINPYRILCKEFFEGTFIPLESVVCQPDVFNDDDMKTFLDL